MTDINDLCAQMPERPTSTARWRRRATVSYAEGFRERTAANAAGQAYVYTTNTSRMTE